MEKSKFEKFIGKYNLGKLCESVTFTVDKGSLTTRANTDDRNVWCEVTGPTFGLPDGEYAIYDTTRLKSLLSVLGETLTVAVNKSNNSPTGILLADSRTEVTYVLADASVIPDVPEIKALPPFELTIKLDDQFTTSFVKACGAIKDVEADTFTVVSKGVDAVAEIVVGYSDKNTNRIKLKVTTTTPTKMDMVSFSSKCLREILVANKDAGSGELHISSRGLARMTFTVDDITSTYILKKI